MHKISFIKKLCYPNIFVLGESIELLNVDYLYVLCVFCAHMNLKSKHKCRKINTKKRMPMLESGGNLFEISTAKNGNRIKILI